MLGTIIVGVILVIIVALIVRSMVHDKKTVNRSHVVATAVNAKATAIKKGGNGWSEILIKTKTLLFLVSSKEGCRITKQRLMLLDVILEEDCSAVKRFITRQ